MKRLTWVAAGMMAGLVITANELHGQIVSPAPDSIVQLTTEALGLKLVSPADLPPHGTYWEMLPGRNGGLLAPLPCPPEDVSLSIFQVAKNIFIIDGTYGQDTSTNAVLADATAVANLIDLVQTPKIQRQRMAMSLSGPPMPGGGGGTNVYYPNGNSYTPPDYGTNLWVAQVSTTNGWLTGIASNTLADVAYEIQSRTNLAQGDWQSEGFIYGAETTNWTDWTVAKQGRPELLIRLRSWIDTFNIGIPDWWQLLYFNETGIDPDASAAHDGFSNLYKFQHGLNPTNYYNPDLPGNFFGAVTGTNAFLYWDKETGATGYLVRRGVLDPGTGDYTYTPFLLDSNATWFADGALTNANAQNNLYTLQAVFPGGGLSGTNIWQVWWYASYASYGPPYGPPPPGHVYAYADATQTNVQIAWTAAAGSRATNYVVERGTNRIGNYSFAYAPIFWAGTNRTSYTATNALTNADNWVEAYAVAAVYPGGGLSYLVPSYASGSTAPIGLGADTNAPAAPANFSAIPYPWESSTNLFLSWDAVPGAVAYLLYAGNWDNSIGFAHYQPLARVGGTTYELAGGADGEGNYTYGDFIVVAVFANGSLSQSAYCAPGTAEPPPPGDVSAYVDATGTNIVISWSPAAGATGYVVQWSPDPTYMNYSETAETNAATTSFVDVDGVDQAYYGLDYVSYQVMALFPNGSYSTAVTAVNSAPPAPAGLTATVTGADVTLAWSAAVGPAISYTILRGTYDPNTGQYSYASIGTVAANTTAFTDPGAAGGNNLYEVEANYAGGLTSLPSALASHLSAPPATANLRVGAQLIRNAAGRWELVFSDLPPGVEQVAFSWYVWDYFYDLGFERITDYYNNGAPLSTETDIPVSHITNGVYVLPDFLTTNWFPNNAFGKAAMLQPVGTNGHYGSLSFAGFQSYDSPVFVDARTHLKENLRYQLRSATISQPKAPLVENVWWNPYFEGENIPVDTNYVESSFYHWSLMFKGYNASYVIYLKRDNLWPITANYELHASLYDTNFTGTTFNWQPDPGSLSFQSTLATVPAPAVLGIPDPYWIPQPMTVSGGIDPATGLPLNTTISVLPDLAAYTNNGALYLRADAHNLFGLAFADALVGQSGSFDPYTGQWYYSPATVLAPGGSTAITNVNCFYSQTVAPDLQAAGYYFAPVNTPGTALPNEVPQTQFYPLPALPGFANTNQTGLLVASVGAPFVLGGWAKLSIHNGDSAKFAYLGQYFVTNAFVVTNGVVTTNTTGIVSPYGDFFPTTPGLAALVTLPDIDTGLQGTGLVRVVSLNVDANHDGTMDFSYRGPDFASVGRPFRFWVNDNQDAGDYGGNYGVPGLMAAQLADGLTASGYDDNNNPNYNVHGRRDLVDFFPVCLNLGSLFQSNVLSAGIDVTDTNYQFVLSQADSALRFAYTSLTPTNYLNFLQDTNVSRLLSDAPLFTIPAAGVPLLNVFNIGIASASQNIILVEATAPTTQPLVLTIYHGTNQIAQTSLPLSITGVEQMFRHKNLLLNIPPAMPDRLTDADAPNEPDTVDKNFVFLHGYNVLPGEARGVASDMFKRMYWAGSHAKFWAVTWEGADSKIGSVFTPNYYTNVVNAFNTAPLLANFIATLTNSGPVVVAAHSLGNMVVLSSISDWNAPISQYFMMDAAVPIEAIDPASTSVPFMTFSTWAGYSNRLSASDWHELFPTNDARSTLTWNNRLGNLRNVDVYNFYSSSEEVLRTTAGDPPLSTIDILATQVINRFSLIGLWPKVPFGTYSWYWQEKGKGTCNEDGLIGSSHGGWKFSSYWVDSSGHTLSPAIMNNTANSTLQNFPMFNFNSTDNNFLLQIDNELLGAVYGVNPSDYAVTNRNRILADAIPAMSLVAGANPVPKFNPTGHNVDMMTLENGWSQGRAGDEAGMWHHSDFVQMAYTFTYQLFNQFVTTGNLK